MQILICAEDLKQAADIQKIVYEIMEKDRIRYGIFSHFSVYTVQNKNGSKEARVYFLPEPGHIRLAKHKENAKELKDKITLELSSHNCQVFYASLFHGKR